MAETVYEFSKINDFPNQTVEPAGFREEILASDISGSLVGINMFKNDDLVNVVFADPISVGDLATLNTLVAAHEGPGSPLRLSRWALIDQDWQKINYVNQLPVRLHKDVLSDMFRGEVRTVTFYDPDDNLTFNSDGTVATGTPVVREDHVYIRDAGGLVQNRTITINWIREDGTDHPEKKARFKHYTPLDQAREGNRRRKNVVDKLKLDIIGLLMATETSGDYATALELAQVFFGNHVDAIVEYMETDNQNLVTDILSDHSNTWLANDIGGGVTIAQYLVNDLLPIV